jgi:tRNA threonylcarbamoyladenosine biosynthesis protein TsaB
MMAAAAVVEEEIWLCPMIDARRMEVFTAIFDHDLGTIVPTTNMILAGNSFETELNQKKIIFFGNGSQKFREIVEHPNAIFKTFEANAQHMTEISYRKFAADDYADLAYAEPFYGKDFYVPVK